MNARNMRRTRARRNALARRADADPVTAGHFLRVARPETGSIQGVSS
jgi:hypothetical protein